MSIFSNFFHVKQSPLLSLLGMGGGGTGHALGGGSGINVKGSGGIIELADNGMVTHIFVTPGVDASTGEGGAFDPDTSQTFVAPSNIPGVRFFVIGGGGGGGYAGGGGAGGAVSNALTGSTITVPAGTYPVTIGGGGHSNWSYSHTGNYGTPSFPAPQPYPTAKANDGPKDGDNSVWNGYTGLGGGSGGTEHGPGGYSAHPTAPHGNAGGCGGGGARYASNGPGAGGDQVQTPQSQGPNGTNYGSDGGNAAGGNYVGGGGGGIGQNGHASSTHPAVPGSPAGGGNGLMIPICPPNYGTAGPSPGRWLGGGGGSSTYPATQYDGGAGGGNDGNILFPDTTKALGWDSPSDIPSNFHTGGGGGAGANHNNRQPTRGNPGIIIIAYPNT
tara:strand:+ start:555 stop:1712 length:1158 start_codon:yes stop_codon:yes gene_type:complete